jgi:hypothetical protein
MSPRLRYFHKWHNGFYGSYKKHKIALERDHPNQPWAFLVSDSAGCYLADGYTKTAMELREAIVYVLKQAHLYEPEATNSHN